MIMVVIKRSHKNWSFFAQNAPFYVISVIEQNKNLVDKKKIQEKIIKQIENFGG